MVPELLTVCSKLKCRQISHGVLVELLAVSAPTTSGFSPCVFYTQGGSLNANPSAHVCCLSPGQQGCGTRHSLGGLPRWAWHSVASYHLLCTSLGVDSVQVSMDPRLGELALGPSIASRVLFSETDCFSWSEKFIILGLK